MFSAISATLLAILDAMIVYGDMFGWAPLETPFAAAFAAAGVRLPAVPVAAPAFRDATVRFAVRLTGADATDAGILTVLLDVWSEKCMSEQAHM